MVSVAGLVALLKEAEMTAEVRKDTVTVEMVKPADDVPAATVTLDGTVATDGLELASATTAPPGGAGFESLTVPVALDPPVTVVGFSVSDESVGDGGGVTMSAAVLVVPL